MVRQQPITEQWRLRKLKVQGFQGELYNYNKQMSVARFNTVGGMLTRVKDELDLKDIVLSAIFCVKKETSVANLRMLLSELSQTNKVAGVDLALEFKHDCGNWMNILKTWLVQEINITRLWLCWRYKDPQLFNAVDNLNKSLRNKSTEKCFKLPKLNLDFRPKRTIEQDPRSEVSAFKCLTSFLEAGWRVKHFWLLDTFGESTTNWNKLKILMRTLSGSCRVVLCATNDIPTNVDLTPMFQALSTVKELRLEKFPKWKFIALQIRLEKRKSTLPGVCLEIVFSKNWSYVVMDKDKCKIELDIIDKSALSELGDLIAKNRLKGVTKLKLSSGFDTMQLLELSKQVRKNRSIIELDIPGLDDLEHLEARQVREAIDMNLVSQMKEWVTQGVEVRYARAKLMFIGKGRVGKTSTIKSLLGQRFEEEEESTPLVDMDRDVRIETKDVALSTWKERKFDKERPMLVGEFRSVLREAGRSEALAPTTSKSKFNNSATKNSVSFTFDEEELGQKVEDSLVRRNSSSDESEQQRDVPVEGVLEEDEERTGNNVKLSIWDFGGQPVYHTIHPLYLTNNGIYCLVFDLESFLKNKEEELEELEFWAQSVFLHAPKSKILLIGTRAKNIDIDQIRSVDESLGSLLRDIPIDAIFNIDETLHYFPIENSGTRSGVDELRQQLVKALDPDLNSESLIAAENISWAWLYFMDIIVEKSNSKITRSEFIAEGKKFGFSNDQDLENMLKFYTKVGAIISFDKDIYGPESVVSDTVILRPQWLLKALAKFLYDPTLPPKRYFSLKQDGETRKMLDIYENHGLIEDKLLNRIFAHQPEAVAGCDMEFVTELCEKMLIMSMSSNLILSGLAHVECSSDSKYWIVPSMNRQVVDVDHIEKTKLLATTLVIKWDRFVVNGLFERSLCIFLGESEAIEGSKNPTIFKTFATFFLRKLEVHFHMSDAGQEFLVSFGSTHRDVIVRVADSIDRLIKELKRDVLGKYYAPELLLVKEGNRRVAFKEASFSKVERPNPRKKSEAKEGEWEFHCFLAHSWGKEEVTHKQVVEIGQRLADAGKLQVWVDEKQLVDYIEEDILYGLVNSACVLAFITKDYIDRCNNPRTFAAKEFQHAASGHKPIIPVVLEKSMLDTTKWFGSKVGFNLPGIKFVDFSSPEAIEENFRALCERIRKFSLEKRPANDYH